MVKFADDSQYWRACTTFASGAESSHLRVTVQQKCKLKGPNAMYYTWDVTTLALSTG